MISGHCNIDMRLSTKYHKICIDHWTVGIAASDGEAGGVPSRPTMASDSHNALCSGISSFSHIIF